MKPEFEGLSLVDLINLLEEVPEPDPISLMPQTPGWVVLGALLLLSLAWCFHWAWTGWKANAYIRAALTELADSNDDPALIAGILRRTALVAFPRSEIAPLVGESWLSFLDDTYPGNGFAEGPGRILATAAYRNEGKSPELTRIADEWIRGHTRKVQQ